MTLPSFVEMTYSLAVLFLSDASYSSILVMVMGMLLLVSVVSTLDAALLRPAICGYEGINGRLRRLSWHILRNVDFF
ncbi:MAG: hypothetical protein IJ734_10800 [Fibrobacter sp.]|nr:hypothetical protein [Fibrobacter sp.]